MGRHCERTIRREGPKRLLKRIIFGNAPQFPKIAQWNALSKAGFFPNISGSSLRSSPGVLFWVRIEPRPLPRCLSSSTSYLEYIRDHVPLVGSRRAKEPARACDSREPLVPRGAVYQPLPSFRKDLVSHSPIDYLIRAALIRMTHKPQELEHRHHDRESTSAIRIRPGTEPLEVLARDLSCP